MHFGLNQKKKKRTTIDVTAHFDLNAMRDSACKIKKKMESVCRDPITLNFFKT